MKKLTHKEEEILSYFWNKGPLFIRELLEIQDEPRPHYNTLSTVVRTLEEKGYVSYKTFGNTHQYYALIKEDEYHRTSLNKLVNKHFGDSYKRVISSFIEEEKITVEELQELIEQIRNNKK